MSWFGETFGDSLTNLKGQITKITKEVLADDETTNDQSKQTDNALIKELEALCESKDLEITSLRDEFEKLQSQYKSEIEFLKNENKKCSNSGKNDQVDVIFQLQNELTDVKKERDHLNSCLDELQSEHQTNLAQVISIKDKFKQELEDLKREHSSTKEQLNALLTQQENNSVVGDQEIKEKNIEIKLLKNEIERLKQEVETSGKEKEKSISDFNKQVETCNDLKKQLEKLSNDVQVLIKENQKKEVDVKNIKLENDDLKKLLDVTKNENEEIKLKLNSVLKEKDELLKNSDKSKELNEWTNQIQDKVKSLLKAFDIKPEEDLNGNNLIEHIDSILNKKDVEDKNKQQQNEKLEETNNNLISEIQKLKEDNEKLHTELLESNKTWTDKERDYQSKIGALNDVIMQLRARQDEVHMNQSQTDDVKRLEQERNHFKYLLQTTKDDVVSMGLERNSLEQQIWNLKTSLETAEKSKQDVSEVKQKLQEEVVVLKNKETEYKQTVLKLEEELNCVKSEKSNSDKKNSELADRLQQLENQISELKAEKEKGESLQSESAELGALNKELKNTCDRLQQDNLRFQNEIKELKAQVIIKESNLVESLRSNAAFQDEMNKLQSQINELEALRKELKKWKDASVDLEIQREDLLTRKEELENECLTLRSQLQLLDIKDAELCQLKQANINLSESVNRLHQELETKIQGEQIRSSKEIDLLTSYQKQSEEILELQEKNNELNSRIQKFQEQMKMQMIQSQNQLADVQQHRRTRSAIDSPPAAEVQKSGNEVNEEVVMLKQAIQQEQAKNRTLQIQFQEISEKESSARREFERLKQHLLEIEDHYTEETVESKKTIEDLKMKLMAAEEQLKNSSTLYTSTKVRDNQHLESLQSQIRLVSAQRDDLQTKLSAAEDEVQKHKASLMSLQIVLEQFQQDKEYELESLATKYEQQLKSTHGRFKDLEDEMETLRNQLSEAKNGLKAASRLGEQLEKKTQHISELEGNVNALNNKVQELEKSLAAANQSNNGKIDKSLIKNLVVGYILTQKADRKAQILRIMASVLDLDQDERNKMGVDNANSGWLSSILHPQSGGSPSNQSLSEAFIRFLEHESRPQPQLKLLPEQFQANKSRASSSSPKPPQSHISELVLPTFSTTQENESSVILKNVLKDS